MSAPRGTGVCIVNKTHEASQKKLDKMDQLGIPLAPLTKYQAVPIQSDEEYLQYWRDHEPYDVAE
ncbi:hypothetical protein N7539_001918 [Penicillium diatomitis]|uniref:Uncharacterized protein n=1 Tax=Penicillium diatomitis TaxID=2819901 RepID=A0A9W9XHP0_9EURO|nr:uncharacterized protein N7539_001918 [Penicillium diatomitis]KAJ5493172.1 hypothetical protein N7539_001918 [Penicillium diatomitis]